MGYCHTHSHNELLFIVKNNIFVENNTDKVLVRAPAAVIHNNFTLHRAYAKSSDIYERYIINFNDESLYQNAPLVPYITFFKSANMTVIQLTEEISKTLLFYINRYKYIHNSEKAKNHLTGMILYELSNYRSDENTIRLEPKLPYINEIMYYIAQNIHESFTLEELAAKYFVSRAKFVSDFRSSTGITVKGYTTLVRMNTARSLLTSGYSVSAAANMCGYNSDSNFIATFKRHFGISPGNFERFLKEQLKKQAPENGTYQLL